MKFQNLILAMTLASSSLAHAEEVKIMHLQMGGGYHKIFAQELTAQPSASGEPVQVVNLPSPFLQRLNPFHITRGNWDFGKVFFDDGKTNLAEVPIAPKSDLKWFQKARETGQLPDVMIISGHHIPGLGWHSNDIEEENDYYTKSLLLSTLLRTREENPDARAYFDNVKFVFISGCWGVANLEPHGEKGELLSQDEIGLMYLSGPQGQRKVLGSTQNFYQLESERENLTQSYPGDFAAEKKDEICVDNKCVTYWIDRVMSDIGLFNNSHQFNQPLNLRKLFPNAALVFGFHSASPFSSTVFGMLKGTVKRARTSKILKDEDSAFSQNIIHSIVSSETPEPTRKRLVQAFREAWTTLTYEQNRGRMANSSYIGGRPGASITPAYPSLDNDGLFVWPKDYKAPAFAPSCFQYRPDAKPCGQAENEPL